VSEDAFLELIVRVCGVTVAEMEVLAGSTPALDLPLTRLSFDSLNLLELQIELEDHEGTAFEPDSFVFTPSTTLRDLFQAVSGR
jgi:acyl carrier protein